MVCVYCNHKSTKVVNSRKHVRTTSTWRRHQCANCHAVFTTREEIDLASALRVQSPSALTAFSRDRLLISVHSSLSHRKTALTDATELLDTITKHLLPLQTNGVIKREQIIKTTIDILRRFDPAAGTHYEAHHNN